MPVGSRVTTPSALFLVEPPGAPQYRHVPSATQAAARSVRAEFSPEIADCGLSSSAWGVWGWGCP